ncbi:diamine acetyltransferase 1-like isoform X2 [Scyliorhinus canicula]|uniref:diamine acetyltransferase 1-like isoform X2 n=1 Tax=Scyliorhinus canicula TaxID=7830 RepID=UPI0018F7C7B8|nr:diamine acetyltransferase 1-like isoform X2 [Scyliorhinus canicula]
MVNYTVRPATPRDCADILRLIKELAKFEEMENHVKLTEKGYNIVGYAMYYYTYDAWIGKLLYLEDFYVMEEFRGYGIGSEILKRISQTAVQDHCSSMHFIVADWNHRSINFYKKLGAADLSKKEGWRLFEIKKKHLVKIATEE